MMDEASDASDPVVEEEKCRTLPPSDAAGLPRTTLRYNASS